MENNKKLNIGNIILIYFIFLAIWFARVLGLNPFTESISNQWIQALVNAAIKVPLWLGLGIFFIKRYKNSLDVSFSEMINTKINPKLLFSVMGLFLIYHVTSMFLTYKGFHLSAAFHPSNLIGTVIVAGIVEEIVFRGFLCNSLLSVTTSEKAVIISSVMFTVIHYPKYIWNGTFAFPEILSTSIIIFILGCVFGYVFSKNRCIWTSVILHMTWNFLVITLYNN